MITKKKGNQYRKIKVWDEDGFEMPNSDIKVRVIKFLEEIHNGDKVN